MIVLPACENLCKSKIGGDGSDEEEDEIVDDKKKRKKKEMKRKKRRFYDEFEAFANLGRSDSY